MSTRSSLARSGRWWEHSRSNVLNVELRPGSPAASQRGAASTTHTRPAESVRMLKPWPKPWAPHTDQNTTYTLYSVPHDLYVVHVDEGDESWLETNGGQGLSEEMLKTFFPQLAENFVGEPVLPHKYR